MEHFPHRDQRVSNLLGNVFSRQDHERERLLGVPRSFSAGSETKSTGRIKTGKIRVMPPPLGALDHDQLIVLALEAGCGKVCGAGAQRRPYEILKLPSNDFRQTL